MVDAVFHLLKITAVLAVSFALMVAIQTFLNLLGSVFLGGVIPEVFSLISMYLPFNASAVFGSLGTATVAILSFMIAKKIFDLTSWSISSI